MQRTIHQTVFRVEPLQNIVGIGNTAAYHIVVSQGSALGTLGNVTVPAQAEVINATEFARNTSNGPRRIRLGSWFRSTLATLQS